MPPRLTGPITGDLQGDLAIGVFVVALVLGLRAADRARTLRGRARWLGVGLGLVGAAILLYVDAINASQVQYADAPIDPTRAAAGQSVYEEHCRACHGARGRGDGPSAASLKQAPADLRAHAFHHDEAYLAALVQQGFGVMPAFRGKLSDEQIANVIQYIRLMARENR